MPTITNYGKEFGLYRVWGYWKAWKGSKERNDVIFVLEDILAVLWKEEKEAGGKVEAGRPIRPLQLFRLRVPWTRIAEVEMIKHVLIQELSWGGAGGLTVNDVTAKRD